MPSIRSLSHLRRRRARRATDRRRRASHAGRHLAHGGRARPARTCSSSARTCSAPAPSSSAAPTTRCRVSRPTERRRGVVDILVRQPRPGGRARGPAARHPARDRDAGRCAGGEARGDRGYGAEVVLYDREREDREAIGRRARRRARARRDSALRSRRHHRRTGNGGARAARRSRPARSAARAVRRRRAAVGHLRSPRARWRPALPRDRRRARGRRRCDAVVPDEARCRRCENPETVADGARTPSLGTLTFPLVLRVVHDMTTVDDRRSCARCSSCGSG